MTKSEISTRNLSGNITAALDPAPPRAATAANAATAAPMAARARMLLEAPILPALSRPPAQLRRHAGFCGLAFIAAISNAMSSASTSSLILIGLVI